MQKVSPPQCLQNAFDEQGLSDLEVLAFPEGTHTAADAATAIGCDISEIGKSLVFVTEPGRPILIIMNGADQVDEARVAGLIGFSIRKATAQEVRDMTGYAIGGVPPFGHTKPVETLLDQKLLQKKTLWLAAGTPQTVFAISPDKLRKATGIETGVNIAA